MSVAAQAVNWTSEQFVAGVSLVAAIIPILVLVLPTGRKRIVYRVPLDAPVSVAPDQAGHDAFGADRDTFGLGIRVLHNGEEVGNPSLVLIRVKNAGRRTVSWRDWEVPLYFSFGGRVVIAAEVTAVSNGQCISDKMILSLREGCAGVGTGTAVVC
jgi:hypothetical protein